MILILAGSYTTDGFGLVSDNEGGTIISLTGQNFAVVHGRMAQDSRSSSALLGVHRHANGR